LRPAGSACVSARSVLTSVASCRDLVPHASSPVSARATIIVIDHDLDLLAAGHLIDMGPGGGPDGGRIVAAGTPEGVAGAPGSVTGPWLAGHLSLPGTAQCIVAATGDLPPPEALAMT
jgi:hypothetical protein